MGFESLIGSQFEICSESREYTIIMRWNWFSNNENNRVLDSISSIATIMAVVAAIFIGTWQNQINNELKNIASKELNSSKTPLLSVDFISLKYDETSTFFIKEVEFSNKGAVPINNIRYQISFPENPKKWEPFNQVLHGVLYQEDSTMRKTVMNKVALNDVQLVVIKVSFVSLFDPESKYCVTRTYTFHTKNELLEPLNLSEPYECN